MAEANGILTKDAKAATPFASFSLLMEAHSALLQREPDINEASDYLTKVREFFDRAQATGAVLDNEDERRTAQSILNYWITTLYRNVGKPDDTTLAEYDPRLILKMDDAQCPYPGVRAFREDENRLFFGRQRQVNYMLGRLGEDRLLAVVGPSGSGKTSLVLAGLLPEMKQNDKLENIARYYFPVITPGSRPLENLDRMFPPSGNAPPAERGPEQRTNLQKGSYQLVNRIEQFTELPVVIVVDQFEEIFTRSNEKDRRSFLAYLGRVIQTPRAKHIVILTMRDDDYDSYLRRPDRFRQALDPAKVSLPQLGSMELREAIEKPGAYVGLKFEEPTIKALVGETISEPVGLPLLQFTLLKLWARHEQKEDLNEAFNKAKSCRAVLARSAEEFFKKLDSRDQRQCQRLLTELIRIDSDLKAYSYPVTRSELYRKAERNSRVDSVIEKLANEQLVRLTHGAVPGDDEVELVHDSLIRSWPRMVSWVETEKRARRSYRAVKLMAAAAGVALFFLVVFWLVGWQQQKLKSRDLARFSSKQLANNRLDLALLLGYAAYQTENNTATRSNLHKLLYNLQFTPQPKRFLRKENFEAIDLSFTTEQDRPPSRLAAINLSGKIVVWDLNWDQGKPPAIERTLVTVSNADSPLIFSPDGKTLATASTDPNVKVILWDLASGQHRDLSGTGTVSEEGQDSFKTFGLVFKPNGETLFSAGENGSVIQWDDLKSPQGVKATTVFKNTSQINSIVLNAKGDLLAAGDYNGAVFLLDVSGKQVLSRVIAQGQVKETVGDQAIYSVAFSSDGQLLAASRIDRAMIWRVQGGQLQREFCTGLAPAGLVVAFSDKDRTLLGYNADGNIFSWNVQRGFPSGIRLYKPPSPSGSASFANNGRLLALPNGDGVTIWDIWSDRVIVAEDPTINSIAFRPGGNTLAVGDQGGITTWQTQNPDERQKLHYSSEESEVLNLAYSADGVILATGLSNGTISLRDSASLQPTRTLTRKVQEDEPVQLFAKIIFDPRSDGHRLVEALNINAKTSSSEIIFWNADTGEQTRTLAVSKDRIVTALAFRPDGKLLAWSTSDANADTKNNSTVSLWDSVGQKQIGNPVQTSAKITSLAFSPDGKVLAVGLNDGKIELLDEDYKQTALFEGAPGEVVDLAFSPDGSILACATNPKSQLEKSRPGTIVLWDLWDMKGEQPEQLGDLLTGHLDAIKSIAFSSDGKTLASASKAEIILWDVNVAGARDRFCEIVDCPRTYNQMAQYPNNETRLQWLRRKTIENSQYLDNETWFQWLYRKTMRKQSLRELNQ
jgi:WD40 repeat protein/Cdc6-like AAA superfamily ATPase